MAGEPPRQAGASGHHFFDKIILPTDLLQKTTCRLTARVTGGWGENGSETGNCHSSEPALKNAQSPSRPVHALLGCPLFEGTHDMHFRHEIHSSHLFS